jgi:sodium transport system permease protein
MYLFPVTLALVPVVALALVPDVRLGSVLALVPVTNVCLAIRESLIGEIQLMPLAVTFATTVLCAHGALRWVASVLEREDVVLGIESPPFAGDAALEARSRRALRFGLAMLFVVWFAGSWLQGSGVVSFTTGLAMTLWVLVLVPAFVYTRITAGRRFDRIAAAIGLRAPSAGAIACALGAAVVLAALNAVYMHYQDGFLPMPKAVLEELDELTRTAGELGWFGGFVLFALSPGITEELLWRGAFFYDLAAPGRPLRAVVIAALFFGAFHLSIYRFVPTAIAGAVLATFRWRSGSIWPSIVLHTAYNTTAAFAIEPLIARAVEAGWWTGTSRLAIAALSALLIVGLATLVRARPSASGRTDSSS